MWKSSIIILCDSLEKQTIEMAKILVFARSWREWRMDRHSTEEFSCSRTILHDNTMVDICPIHLLKPIEYATPKINPHVNHGLWVIMCQCRFIFVQMFYSSGGCWQWWGYAFVRREHIWQLCTFWLIFLWIKLLWIEKFVNSEKSLNLSQPQFHQM